jgi:hypothetical protein
MSVKRAIPTCVLMAMMGIVGVSSINAVAGTNHYRWTDERGYPVHSDRPPPKGVDYEVITTGSSLVRQVEAEEGAVPAEIVPRVGNDFEQVNTAKQETEKNPEYCERARQNIQSLDTNARIRVRNEQGEYHWLSQEEKAAQRLQAEATITEHCD